MASVTIRLILALFATTQIDGTILLSSPNDWFQICGRVGSVTERLLFTQSTATPGVALPSPYLGLIGSLLRYDRIRHFLLYTRGNGQNCSSLKSKLSPTEVFHMIDITATNRVVAVRSGSLTSNRFDCGCLHKNQ